MAELYPLISKAVAEKTMLRLVVTLCPANADGHVYPPTYDQGQHIFRPSWIDGESRESVLLDSVQSQANRIELAVLEACHRGQIEYPDIELRVNADTGEEMYSVLELSHRVYDAALRMTTLDGKPFAKSDIGRTIYSSRTEKATALYTHAPMTLVLGGWDSHGGGGPLVAKLPRLVTSEIVGLDAKPIDRGAVKFDPMDIRKDAGPFYESGDSERQWEIDKAKASKNKEYKPSEVGLGNVPNFSHHGAVITNAVQTSLISCSAVRRLRFEKRDGTYDDTRDHAGQTAIVALGLFGLMKQMESGYNLRSGCDLIPEKEPKLEIIGRSLEDLETHSISAGAALSALNKALSSARDSGLEWRKEKVVADADERLVTAVERSRRSIVGDV